ncbi:MAG: MBL fold metallo-hydrolase [Eubacteriales bacterium]
MPYQLVQDIYIYQSSMWQTNSSVILNEAANVVIDPCYFPVEIQVIADFVNRKKSFNKYIIFTHSDFDHIVGYQYFKGAKLIGQEEVSFCDRESQLMQLREIDQTYYINRKIPFVFPNLDKSFTRDYRIPLKEDEIVLVHAPGHTGDSSFVISRGKMVMFAGDYMSDLEFPFIYFNSGAYLKSLNMAGRLVEDFDIEYVVPGHGDIAKGRKEIFDRIDSDKEYLLALTDKAQELLIQGLQEREITEVLTDIKYRNEPIEGAMIKMHIENVKLVLKELHIF